jgi:hypothetical protein
VRGDTLELRGSVRNAVSGDPLSGAFMMLHPADDLIPKEASATSSVRGAFEVRFPLWRGRQLVVHAIGYESIRTDLDALAAGR